MARVDGILGLMAGQEAGNGSLRFSAFGMDQSPSYAPLENDQFIAYVLPMCCLCAIGLRPPLGR
jgi:hypothetical protein